MGRLPGEGDGPRKPKAASNVFVAAEIHIVRIFRLRSRGVGLSSLSLVSAEHACDRVAEQNAAGDAHRGLRRTGEEAAAGALLHRLAVGLVLVPPRRAGRSAAVSGLLRRLALRGGIAAEHRGEQAAALLALRGLRLQFLDAALSRLQRLLLHADGLCHVIGCTRLRADPFLDEAVGLSVSRAGLALDMGELEQQAVNGLLFVAIPEMSSLLSAETTTHARQ